MEPAAGPSRPLVEQSANRLPPANDIATTHSLAGLDKGTDRIRVCEHLDRLEQLIKQVRRDDRDYPPPVVADKPHHTAVLGQVQRPAHIDG